MGGKNKYFKNLKAKVTWEKKWTNPQLIDEGKNTRQITNMRNEGGDCFRDPPDMKKHKGT